MAHEDCICSKYCWFGAVRDTANLHDVHPFNRLMDENGEITPLFVSLKSIYRSRTLMGCTGVSNTYMVGMSKDASTAVVDHTDSAGTAVLRRFIQYL